jgi:hypothetical protein
MIYAFADTHSYPGCRVTIRDDKKPGPVALVEFSDGSIAHAVQERVGPNEIILTIGTYATGRGTRIPEKSWIVKRAQSGNDWKVARRLRKPIDAT